MSRLIVKNLPKDIKKEKLAELFGTYGEITDLRMCKTKAGDFRKFAFVGFKAEEQATNALKFFNKSYINTSKLHVEIAKDIGDETVPRPWSKYSHDSSAFSKLSKENEERKQRIKELQNDNPETHTNEKVTKEKKENTVIQENDDEEAETDENLNEFLIAHKTKSTKKIWANEIAGIDNNTVPGKKLKKTKSRNKKDSKMESEKQKEEKIYFEVC